MDIDKFLELIDDCIEQKSACTVHGSVISPTTVQILERGGETVIVKLPYKENSFVVGAIKLKDIIACIQLPVTFDEHYKAVMDEKKAEEDALKARVEEGKRVAKEIAEKLDKDPVPQQEG
jgi:hypothetical protein